MSTQLVRYDAMCSAIAAAYTVDEVKEIHDKALAIEAYARQAKNTEAERQACEIRLRAERRAGQMLGEMNKAKGGGDQRSDHRSHDARGGPQPLADIGISHTQSSRWQKLAAIPEDQFEATFARSEKPSTTGLIAEHAKPKQRSVDPRALWLWGRLLDFERQGLLASDPAEICETMLDHMKETVRELAPSVVAWLRKLDP